MSDRRHKSLVGQLLELAGVEIGGAHPWDIQVHDDRAYRSILTEAELGLGESYMAGWWDAEEVDEFICRILRADLQDKVRHNLRFGLQLLGFKLINMQKKSRAFIIGERHYDPWKRAVHQHARQEDELQLRLLERHEEPR